MGLEQSRETWVRVDLFCDGLGDDATTCVAYGDPDDPHVDMPMVTDCCPTAEDARRLTLYAATRGGWIFDIHLQRWLCPYCVKVRNEGLGQRAARE
jgi:hypothetical protein